jgi:hypothetical protein
MIVNNFGMTSAEYDAAWDANTVPGGLEAAQAVVGLAGLVLGYKRNGWKGALIGGLLFGPVASRVLVGLWPKP